MNMPDAIHYKQCSEAWFQSRLGRATASRIADVMAKTKSGYSTSRENYMVQLALERITGVQADSYTNAAIQWGRDTEPLARAAYEVHAGVLVEEVGMIEHPRIAMAGASPDGTIGADGLLEIKCPNSATHVNTLRSRRPSGEYITQMQWQLSCTGRAWCDFVSFDPRMPDGLQLFVIRVPRDDDYIVQLEIDVERFLEQVDAMVRELNALREAS